MLNMNSAFEEELYVNFLRDRDSVTPEWRAYFDKIDGKVIEYIAPVSINKTKPEAKANIPNETVRLAPNEVLEAMSSIQRKISDNMEISLEVPTATSVREIPVKALDENRRIANKYLSNLKKRKISFTHLISWAVVRALIKYPSMNDAFTKVEGIPHRIRRTSVNFGVAIDVTRKDGSRLLMVPSVKDAQNLNFNQFIAQMDILISKARASKLDLNDLSGATVSLTNPGMAGTTHSIPRLMKGQGLIIASGSIDYPVEFQAVRPEVLTTFAVSKVVTITNTYDHRIIQGAESAEFLAYINKLLLGEEMFYEQIFASLKVPFEPLKWQNDISFNKNFGLVDPMEQAEKAAHVMLLINAYRVRGHLLADVNPLGRASYYYPELDPAYYNFSIWDLDRVFHADDSWNENNMPLRDIIELLRYSYCGKIGYEFMHIQSPEKKGWIKYSVEKSNKADYSITEKQRILKKLLIAEEFENFLHTKFVGYKRFSLEGSESLVVMMDKLLNMAADEELNTAVIGMSHRGRLNVLVNNANKPMERVFDEFDGYIDSTIFNGSGDVKYHLGWDSEFTSLNNNRIKIMLSPNPSHLELVNPVIEGMARAIANKIGDKSYTRIFPVLIHGDAAFAGQGIVAETLNMSELDGYKTGGTVHIVVNNQIGFTTTAEFSRSTVYATDIAKMLQAPILHVNGDDPEAVAQAAEFAFNYRQKFNGDVVIDMLCYRKYGHNEGDEPGYTQPLLYKKIKAMRPISELYREQLAIEKVFTPDEMLQYQRDIQQELYKKFNERQPAIQPPIKAAHDMFARVRTEIPEEDLQQIGNGITHLPPADEFTPNPKVKSVLAKRKEMMLSRKPLIDWAMAEELAFGSLLIQGNEVRFSGQDTRRGTFSQRHAVLTDIETENIYIPLNNIRPNQAVLRIFDSPLSEVSVMGFEYGYSLIFQDGLTLWEAQFGDFANNAQVMIDQYIVCAESKWGKASNLTLLLPHSYEGQGAEHSSGRIERYLQQAADDNIIVANLSTPAQYFHILRRQVMADYRKPLILFTPKSMLRNPLAVSAVSDFTDVQFQELIDDQIIKDKDTVRKLVFCSGKVYYDILQEYLKAPNPAVAIIRIEQFYPFHEQLFNDIAASYPNVQEYVWAQEEPKNQGAWSYLMPILSEILDARIKYIGRAASAASASASYKLHQIEQARIVEEALRVYQ